jgi:uncharacterized RDD family membrane protein YckC
VKGQTRYAGLGSRFLALVVDMLLFCAVFFPVTRLVKGVWVMSAADHRWTYGWLITDPLCLVFMVLMVSYFILLEGLIGTTLGKRAVGIRVVDLDGRKPGLRRGLIRNLLRVVDTLPALNLLGVVLILTSKERARFGDWVAGTRVVHT